MLYRGRNYPVCDLLPAHRDRQCVPLLYIGEKDVKAGESVSFAARAIEARFRQHNTTVRIEIEGGYTIFGKSPKYGIPRGLWATKRYTKNWHLSSLRNMPVYTTSSLAGLPLRYFLASKGAGV